MTVSRSWSAVISTTLALILMTTFAKNGQRAATPPGPYVVTDLGTLGAVQSAHATDINEAGEVVGAAPGHAFIWKDGTMSDLGTLGGSTSSAAAINDAGQIVGGSTLQANSTAHAVLWQFGTKTDLTPGTDGTSATGINDMGQVVGNINNWIAFLLQDGVMTNLGHLGGGGSFASDINNAGHVVGSSYSTHVTELGPMQHAFLWKYGVMTDLGVLPGGDDESGAGAINEFGHIVGSSGHTDPTTYEITSRTFIYKDGVMTPLPVPSWESYAGDINDSGIVVGTMRAGGGGSHWHAYIYADGVVTDLNNLIPSGSGLHLAYATGINNVGQIVGVAFDARMYYHAYLLTPVGPNTPVVNIGDASITEGHAGTKSVSLNVTLSPASSQQVTVAYGTANGTAAAGSDYQSASGTVTFEPGQTTQTISVVVNGDRAAEPNETFLVNLGQASGGAVIADVQGVGTIVDDEPRGSINSVTKNEGNSGTTPFVFTVSLSPAPGVPVSLNFATANGDAKAGEDFGAKSGSLAFAAGETSKTITVAVKGDRKKEWQEVFYVNLSGATGAVMTNTQGTGVIRNDD